MRSAHQKDENSSKKPEENVLLFRAQAEELLKESHTHKRKNEALTHCWVRRDLSEKLYSLNTSPGISVLLLVLVLTTGEPRVLHPKISPPRTSVLIYF